MSFPSISSLLQILIDLAYRVAQYYFFGGSWTNVTNQTTKLRAWYEQLERWVKYYADYIVAALRSWTTDWVNYLNYWRGYLVDQAGWAASWINGYLQPLWQWYSAVRSRVDDLVYRLWSWISWFYGNPLNALEYYLGYPWLWLRGLVANPVGAIEAYLGSAWQWLKWFWSNPTNAIRYYLGGAWDWLTWFWSNPLNAIRYYLGSVWDWLVNFAANPLAIIEALLGAVWGWLKILYGLRDYNLFGFIRDAMVYWYTLWRDYRTQLFQFLSDPVGYILAAIRDAFLDWLEQLIAENW